jgi:hypothetical protein
MLARLVFFVFAAASAALAQFQCGIQLKDGDSITISRQQVPLLASFTPNSSTASLFNSSSPSLFNSDLPLFFRRLLCPRRFVASQSRCTITGPSTGTATIVSTVADTQVHDLLAFGYNDFTTITRHVTCSFHTGHHPGRRHHGRTRARWQHQHRVSRHQRGLQPPVPARRLHRHQRKRYNFHRCQRAGRLPLQQAQQNMNVELWLSIPRLTTAFSVQK